MNINRIINDIYQTNTNYSQPDQAINQAESLKSLSSDLYTDSKRFIYELLQNADDSSVDHNLVNVEIRLFGNKLVVAHTGKEFNKLDIKGICNINNGTKKSSIEKTGYKGIGFKSVFGQSDKVTIFSNYEYFKFDANHNFGWKKEWDFSQKEWEKTNNRSFLYPWQIIPVYTSHDEIDVDIKTFLHTKWNVATIIELFKVDEVKKAIEELSSNVNMFLFLKNINSLKFSTNKTVHIKINREKENELTIIQDSKLVAEWIIRTKNLEVSEKLRRSLQNERNIPEKLLTTDNIELTMAIKKGKKGLVKLSKNENLLYAYLPTDEKRYSLPILVNTTFLTSANRESLHADSKWNQWLFMSISIELFTWIASLVKEEYSYQAYQLIPKKLIISDDLSKAYNKGIEEAIETVPFILSKKNQLLKVNEAIIDATLLSEKTFIDSGVIRKFIINKIGNDSKITKKPFVPNTGFNNLLEKIGVRTFEWSDIPAFFAFNNFKSEHTVDKNIQLIGYLKNESEVQDSPIDDKKLRSWAFILDHKSKLNYPNNIYFPTPDDTTWNNPESALSYLHQDIQTWLAKNQKTREWLEKLGVVEKTDISFLEKTIIPNSENYVTQENALETIQTIYNLYQKEKIEDMLAQLSSLKLLTKSGIIMPASHCYFSDNYNPRLNIEELIDNDIFLSEDYLVLDSDRDEIKRFFRIMGVREGINLLIIKDKTSKTTLIHNHNFKSAYFSHSLNAYGFSTDAYKNIVSLELLSKTSKHKFSKVFWQDIINNINLTDLNKNATAYWGYSGMPGQINGNKISNYLHWYIQNTKSIPTINTKCKKSTSVFINSDEIVELAGKYLPVFDGEVLNQDWKAFFNFKIKLELADYLKLLSSIMKDPTDEDKLKESNKKRVQRIFSELLEQSGNWNTEVIEQVKAWSKSALLVDEDYNIINCNELKYYADGDISIFQGIYHFIVLNEENRSHQNIENFLGYIGIEILRQSHFDIELEGEKSTSNLKEKLENIFPYLEKWLTKLDNEFTEEQAKELREILDQLHIYEASKLSLSYNGNVLKRVQLHLENNELIVTSPWHSNKVLISLPKVLCDYFDLKGHEDKLEFLLREDDEFEIIEYFTNENIDLPTQNIPANNGDILSKEEAISNLQITEEEFDTIKKISDSFYHVSDSSIDKLQYIHRLLKRSRENIIKHLSTLDEYDCDDVDHAALTVLSGILKNDEEIYIIPRPSDNGQVIIFYSSELDALEYKDSELWYEDGASIPKKLTLGKILKDTKINRIPV